MCSSSYSIGSASLWWWSMKSNFNQNALFSSKTDWLNNINHTLCFIHASKIYFEIRIFFHFLILVLTLHFLHLISLKDEQSKHCWVWFYQGSGIFLGAGFAQHAPNTQTQIQTLLKVRLPALTTLLQVYTCAPLPMLPVSLHLSCLVEVKKALKANSP